MIARPSSVFSVISVANEIGGRMAEKKKVAAVVTEYRRHSHADVIVGKIIEGYNYDGKDGP